MAGMPVAKPGPAADAPTIPPFRDRIVAARRAALGLRLDLHPDLGHQGHIFVALEVAPFASR